MWRGEEVGVVEGGGGGTKADHKVGGAAASVGVALRGQRATAGKVFDHVTFVFC